MKISEGSVVEIDYHLKNDNGETLDKSQSESPLAYLHGYQNLISGLEKQLEGKQEGEQLQVTIEPEEAYGERSEELITTVGREELAQIPDVQVGMQLQAQTPQGNQILTVTEVTDNEVTLDSNHPLAGMRLNFDVEVVSVREASDEEKTHGHVHGEGDDQH